MHMNIRINIVKIDKMVYNIGNCETRDARSQT